MTTSSPSDALASNRENCTTSSPRLTSFTIFFFLEHHEKLVIWRTSFPRFPSFTISFLQNIMKNLFFAEKVSQNLQVSKFSFYKIYLLLEEQVSSNLQVSKKNFSRMSFRLCYLKNRFPHIYKFYIFIYRLSRRKLLLEEQFIYWCIIVIICSVWQKDRKRLLLLFGK